MSKQEPTRGDVVAALSIPTFMTTASHLTGSQLRQLVAERLATAGLDVVVIAVNGIGASLPFPGAELVWQHRTGGEFRRQVVSWNIGQTAVATQRPSGAFYMIADCAQCGQRNELTLDGEMSIGGLPCSACGSPLISLDQKGTTTASEAPG